jgi:putative intracellular protease/amidase
MSTRILMIVTSNDTMGSTGKPTGLWAEEFAVPYYALADAGAAVELASPAGGPAPIDPASIKPAGENDPMVERYLADPEVQTRVAHTKKVSDIDVTQFDAVFFPGGHGTMWDLPVDPAVRHAVEHMDAACKIVASVCHGAAGLVSARRPDGAPVVAGRKINAFTDAEEAAVGLTEVVPFKLESRLRELGAVFEGAPEWQPFAIRDGHFITGQNPQSSALVAGKVLHALGLSA